MKKNRNTFYLVCSTFLYAICAGLSIYSALLLGKIIDSATVGNVEDLFYYLIFCAIIFVLYLILTKVGITFRMAYVQKKMLQLKKETIKQILKMPIPLFKEKDQAYYVNSLTTDVEKVEEKFYCAIPRIAFSVCSFICAVVSLIYVNYLLLISYVIFFVIALFIPQLLTGTLTKKQKENSVSNESYISSIKELSEGWETIKLNESGKEYYNRIEQLVEDNQKKRCKVRGLEAFVSTVSEMSGSFSQLACIAFGGYMVTKGSISVGDLIIAIQLVQIAFSSISDVSDRITQLNSVKPLVDKLEQIKFFEKTKNFNSIQEKECALISYQNISFGFEQKQILKNFNFELEKNKIYAIVGESGKGKSTIARLLLKYYNNFTGEVLYQGKSIHELSDSYIYANIKYVSQDTFLFNDSIRNNITLYRDYDENEFEKVVSQTNLGELIKSYGEQSIGDFGNKISGGERQRIALARALLKQPEVIIFDEPTSALDPKNTKEILETIFTLENVTRIVVTHIWDKDLLDKFDGVIRLE